MSGIANLAYYIRKCHFFFCSLLTNFCQYRILNQLGKGMYKHTNFSYPVGFWVFLFFLGVWRYFKVVWFVIRKMIWYNMRKLRRHWQLNLWSNARISLFFFFLWISREWEGDMKLFSCMSCILCVPRFSASGNRKQVGRTYWSWSMYFYRSRSTSWEIGF